MSASTASKTPIVFVTEMDVALIEQMLITTRHVWSKKEKFIDRVEKNRRFFKSIVRKCFGDETKMYKCHQRW